MISFGRYYDDNGDNYCTWNIYWLYTDWVICCFATLYQLEKLHSVIWARYVCALWMWKGGRGSSHGMHKIDIFMEVLRETVKNVVRLASSVTGIWIKYKPDTNEMCCHRANLLRSNLVGGKMGVSLKWRESCEASHKQLSQSHFHMEFVQSNAIYIRFIFIMPCVTMFYTLTATF